MSDIELGRCPLRELRLTGDEPVFRSLADPTKVILLSGQPPFACTVKAKLQEKEELGLGRCSNPFIDFHECPWARVNLADDSLEGPRKAVALILSIYFKVISETDELH